MYDLKIEDLSIDCFSGKDIDKTKMCKREQLLCKDLKYSKMLRSICTLQKQDWKNKYEELDNLTQNIINRAKRLLEMERAFD